MVNGDRSLMHMRRHVLERVDVHAHVHPIILYACSAHVQCQGHGSDTIKALG